MTIRADLIPRVVVKLQGLFGVGSVHDRNISAEKSSANETLGVFTPAHEIVAEASCKNQVAVELKIRYFGPSKASAQEHYKKLQVIEDLMEKFVAEEIENPSGSNYTTIDIEPAQIETNDEEDLDRIDSIITFIVRYEYLRGQANVK